VDDGIYINFFDIARIEHASAASIKAIFTLLGPFDLDKWQDPNSFDKLKETVICPINRPVRAMLHIAQWAHCLQLPALCPAAVYFDPCASSSLQISGRCVTTFLSLVAQSVYKLPANSPQLKLWSPHSIWVTAANLLHQAHLLDPFIKNRLRWKSDSFLMILT
jgi:hypothetical protein